MSSKRYTEEFFAVRLNYVRWRQASRYDGFPKLRYHVYVLAVQLYAICRGISH